MQSKIGSDYSNWYVLHVTSGREKYIKDIILRYSDIPIDLRIFSREIIHKIRGNYIKLLNILFPGYIFVYKEILKVKDILNCRLKDEFANPVSFDYLYPSQVKKEEMEFFLKNSNLDGVIQLSYCIKSNNKIKILKGPLKELEADIIFVNEKKRKAKIAINMFNREMKVSLGFEFLQLGA